MSDFPIHYEETRVKNFWCEQDAKWHPECDCKAQCWHCALVQNSERKEQS